MSQENYIYKDRWFTFLPVKTKNAGWIWFKTVDRIIDERPVQYLGLLPVISYYYQKTKENPKKICFLKNKFVSLFKF